MNSFSEFWKMVVMVPEQIENRMVVDSEWGEIEYGVPCKRRLQEERRIYDEIEMEDDDE